MPKFHVLNETLSLPFNLKKAGDNKIKMRFNWSHLLTIYKCHILQSLTKGRVSI